jgi:hypothetical protein
MGLPLDHVALLRQHDFLLPANGALDERERHLLLRYGRWLEALSTGRLQPLTPEQEHFVRVSHGEESPSTEFERAWVKVSRLRSQAVGAEPQSSACLGPMEVAGRCARLAEARHSQAVVRAEYEQRRAAVLEVVRTQLEALDREFGELIHAANEAVAQREAEVREAVLQVGESVKHEGVHAVYARGRVSWDNEGLSRYAETHPEVQDFRSVGTPSVSIRYRTAEKGQQTEGP